MQDVARTAIVTGASSGIGRAVALRLAAEGYQITLIGRDAVRLGEVATRAEQSGGSTRCIRADLSKSSDLDRLGSELTHQAGGIDVLVHSAGIARVGASIRDEGEQALEEQFRVNALGPYFLTRALLPSLVARKGQVVFVNSTGGLRSKANAASYCMSKHALRALADGLREEVNPQGIRVLSVFLGRTATPMQAAIHHSENRPYSPQDLLQPEDVAAVIAQALSLPATAEVTDVYIRPMRKTY